jgi:zinc transport system substrate-binding protein
VITIDGSDQKIAKTVINTAEAKDVSILTLASMQSKTAKDLQDGVTYVKLMEQN